MVPLVSWVQVLSRYGLAALQIGDPDESIAVTAFEGDVQVADDQDVPHRLKILVERQRLRCAEREQIDAGGQCTARFIELQLNVLGLVQCAIGLDSPGAQFAFVVGLEGLLFVERIFAAAEIVELLQRQLAEFEVEPGDVAIAGEQLRRQHGIVGADQAVVLQRDKWIQWAGAEAHLGVLANLDPILVGSTAANAHFVGRRRLKLHV